MRALYISVLALAGAVFALGIVHVSTSSAHASPPSEWPMTPLERQSLRGLTSRIGVLNEEIARISSGDEALSRRLYALAQGIQSLDRDEDELRREAEKRLGVAVVQSGMSWVAR